MSTLGKMRAEQASVFGVALDFDTATGTEIRLRSRRDRIMVGLEKFLSRRTIRHRNPVTVHPLLCAEFLPETTAVRE